jgi:Transglycosylase SLT domain
MRAYGLTIKVQVWRKLMTKRKLDDLEWDHSLDYEFEDPFAPSTQQKKRGVVSRVATNFTKGAKESVMSYAALKALTSGMLPKGYGAAINLGEEVYRQGEELHNIARKEWEPSIPVMRRLTQRHLKKTKKFLPKSTYDRLDEFSKTKSFTGMPSSAQLQDQELARQEAEIFGVQMEASAQMEAENRSERAIQHAQLIKTSRQQIHALNIVQQGVLRLVDYQDDITNRFQRRSLELKTRHYLIARDSFRLQTESARRIDAKLEALVTNTAMPDIAKQDLKHTATQTFRNKLLGGMQDSAGRWASGYLKGMTKRAGENLRDVLGNSESALSMLDGESEMPWQDFLMQAAGKKATESAIRFAGGRLAPVLAKRFPGLAQSGGRLGRGANSLPQLLNRYAKSTTSREGMPGIMEDVLKSILGKHELNTTVGQHGLGNLDKPAAWDKLSRRTLVEVIPGLLSRIEHNTARVLDPKAERQVFSHDSREFTSVRTASVYAAKQLFSPSNRASIKQNVNKFINDLIGNEPISADTRKSFIRQVLLDSGNGEPFDPERYTSAGSNTAELDARAKTELGAIFKRVGVLDNGGRDQVWMADRSEEFNKIDFGAYLPTSAASVYRSTGARELLMDQNLLLREKDKDKLNMARIFEMIEESSYGDIEVKETTAGERLRNAAKGKISRFTKDVTDLYVQGGSKAVLEASKLKTGAYRDAVSGLVITKWADITGPVLDLTTNTVVADLTQLTAGLYDAKGKKISFSMRSVATGAFDWTTEQTNNNKQTITPKAKELKDVVNARGEVLLSGVKLQSGQYRDALTKKVIQNIEDIAGPVIDENGNTVVTAADIVGILAVKGGRSLDDVVTRMRARTNTMLSQANLAPDNLFGQPKADPAVAASSNFMQEPGASVDGGELVRLNSEQVELLKLIAQILTAQGPNGDGQDPMFRRGFLDTLAIGGIKGAVAGIRGVAKGSWWWTKKVVGTAAGGVGMAGPGAGAILQGGAHRVGNLVRGIKDIYVQGKRTPVMIAQRIKMGHYRDVNSGKRIVRYTDVTGPVIDLTTGETILDQDDFEKGLYVKGPAGLVRLANRAVMNFGSAVVSFFGNAGALPFRAAGLLLKGAGATMKWATNKQVDVYVKGESSPRLQASKMKLGRYYNVSPKKMGVVVRTYDDIYGEIKELQPGSYKAQADDKTVLYEDEIHNPGLTGRWGLPLRTPLARLIGAVGGAAVSVVKGAGALFGGAMKGYGKLFGGMMGLGGGLIGAPFKFLGSLLNPFEKHGAKQVEWLERIYNLIDQRLPGAKPRKGSWQEQFMSRDEKNKSKQDEQKREEKDRKWGMGGLLSFFKDKAKGWMGSGDADEDEDENNDYSGGDTTIIATGGGADGQEDGKGKRKPRKPTPGKKGGYRRNRRAKKLRNARAARGKGGRFSRLANPKALLAGTLLAGGAGMAMDGLGLDEDSTAGKVVNGVTDTAGTIANIASLASLARAVPWIGGLLGGGAATAGATGAAATAAGAGASGAAAATTAATAATAAGGVTAGGAAAAAGTGVAAVGGGAAAVLGAPIWIPLAIGAGVVAAGGAGLYFAHKQSKYGKMTPIRRFRYLQYGISPGDADNNKKIFMLEELLLDHVGVVNGGLEIVSKSNSGEKDITMKDVYELMDMEDGWFSDNKQQRQVFNIWYGQRFKPIFLMWVKGLRELDPSMSILDADDKLAGEKQDKLVKKAWTISRNVYANSAGPFEGTPAVTDYSQIEDAYNLALKEAGKSSNEKTIDKWKSRALNLIPGMGLVANYVKNQVDESQAQKEGAHLTAKAMEANAGMNMVGTTGIIKHTQGVEDYLTSPLSRLGKITALTAIRYRAYGLSDLDVDRVRALAALETFVFKKVSIASSGNAYFPLDNEQAYMAACGLFGLTANSPQDRIRWSTWFGRRFLPVCLAYVKAVKHASPSADLQSPERMLKADQLMGIGQQMLNTKDFDGRSIWFWTISPWSANEKLNSDSNAISGSMLALKLTADKKVMAEEKLAGQDTAVKKNKSMLDTMLDSMREGKQSASDWLLGDQKNRNWLGKAVDSASTVASDMTQGAKNAYSHATNGNWGSALSTTAAVTSAPARAAFGALGFGPGLGHPGKGTGGDINQLPTVPSNGEIAAMKPAQRFAVLKPMLDAVAKMTGVDPNMLYAIASIESTFNPSAKAPTSSASGLYQFINDTWANMLRKHAKTYGLSANASPFDPRANALMGAMFLKENFGFLKKRLGRGINETDMYMAHFMGAGGAADFLSRDPNLNAVQAFPKAAKANPWIFYQSERQGNRMRPNMSKPMTIGGVYQLMQQKVNKAQSVYGGRQQGGSGGGGGGGGQPSSGFSNVAATLAATKGTPTDGQPWSMVSKPTTTTTTANGTTGGVGAVQQTQMMPTVGTQVAVKAGSAGVNSLATGGGYASMMAGAGSTTPVLAAAAPSITSTASLDAAAARDEAAHSTMLEKERQQREQQSRAAEAQSQRQSQTDLAQMSRVGEILQKSYETQQRIEKNTSDTVSVLRDLLRQSGSGQSVATADAKVAAATSTTSSRTTRPLERGQDRLPIDMSHQPYE